LSDDKKDYARAIRRHTLARDVRHRVFPNPKRGSKGAKRTPEALARDRAMFPIDTLHRFFRHSVKGHARETIAFGRRNEAQLERAHLFAIFRSPRETSIGAAAPFDHPAMWIGLADAR
jgi:hypothetical protein